MEFVLLFTHTQKYDNDDDDDDTSFQDAKKEFGCKKVGRWFKKKCFYIKI